jgi:hypothetical protein
LPAADDDDDDDVVYNALILDRGTHVLALHIRGPTDLTRLRRQVSHTHTHTMWTVLTHTAAAWQGRKTRIGIRWGTGCRAIPRSGTLVPPLSPADSKNKDAA